MTECIHCGATDEPQAGIVVGVVGHLNETVCNICRAEMYRDAGFGRKEAYAAAHMDIGVDRDEEPELLKKNNIDIGENPRKTLENARYRARKKKAAVDTL